jgi:hypothetical protein
MPDHRIAEIPIPTHGADGARLSAFLNDKAKRGYDLVATLPSIVQGKALLVFRQSRAPDSVARKTGGDDPFGSIDLA